MKKKHIFEQTRAEVWFFFHTKFRMLLDWTASRIQFHQTSLTNVAKFLLLQVFLNIRHKLFEFQTFMNQTQIIILQTLLYTLQTHIIYIIFLSPNSDLSQTSHVTTQNERKRSRNPMEMVSEVNFKMLRSFQDHLGPFEDILGLFVDKIDSLGQKVNFCL